MSRRSRPWAPAHGAKTGMIVPIDFALRAANDMTVRRVSVSLFRSGSKTQSLCLCLAVGFSWISFMSTFSAEASTSQGELAMTCSATSNRLRAIGLAFSAGVAYCGAIVMVGMLVAYKFDDILGPLPSRGVSAAGFGAYLNSSTLWTHRERCGSKRPAVATLVLCGAASSDLAPLSRRLSGPSLWIRQFRSGRITDCRVAPDKY